MFLRISEAANLADHGLAYLATTDESATATQMGDALGVSRHHLGKVLQRLAHSGLVVSRRGPRGGFVLGKPPDEVMLLEIVEAIDGPFQPVGCLTRAPICGVEQCLLAGLLSEIGLQVREFLAKTPLSALPRVGDARGTRSST